MHDLHSKKVYPGSERAIYTAIFDLGLTLCLEYIVGGMFKKKKDKKRDEAAKNAKNRAKESISPPPAPDSLDNLDDTDGFDENGFVDLQPIESDGTLLGPRQKCKVYNVVIRTQHLCSFLRCVTCMRCCETDHQDNFFLPRDFCQRQTKFLCIFYLLTRHRHLSRIKI